MVSSCSLSLLILISRSLTQIKQTPYVVVLLGVNLDLVVTSFMRSGHTSVNGPINRTIPGIYCLIFVPSSFRSINFGGFKLVFKLLCAPRTRPMRLPLATPSPGPKPFLSDPVATGRCAVPWQPLPCYLNAIQLDVQSANKVTT